MSNKLKAKVYDKKTGEQMFLDGLAENTFMEDGSTVENEINKLKNSNVITEVENARGEYSDLKNRLDNADREINEIKNSKKEFLISGFTTNNQNLMLYTSKDGVNLNYIGTPYLARSGEIIRDPSIVKHNGIYYICYSTGWDKTFFGVAKSKDLIKWDWVCNIPIPPAYEKAWAPEFFIDDDNKIYIVCSCALVTNGIFEMLLFSPLNAEMTSWSTGEKMQGDIPNGIDGYIVKKDGKYHLWYTNRDNRFLEYSSSDNLLTGWTQSQSGDWAGWGKDVEGGCIVKLPNGNWRMYFDAYNELPDNYHYYYSDSSDWITWTPKKKLNAPSGIRHCTVLVNDGKDVSNYIASKTNDCTFVELESLSTKGIIDNLVLERNALYYAGNNPITINDVDITNLNTGDKVTFVLASGVATAGITLKKGNNIVLGVDYVINLANGANDMLFRFETILLKNGKKSLRALTPPPNKIRESWHDLTSNELLNNWVNFGSPSAKIGYMKDSNGIVRLKGRVKGGDMNKEIFILPAGYRPIQQYAFLCPSSDVLGQITIDANGLVIPRLGGNTYFDLCGVSFRQED